MSRFWSLASLAVMGIIVADLLIHPAGTQAAFSGASTIESNVGSQLLGTATSKA